MFSLKPFVGLIFTGLFFTSCSPSVPLGGVKRGAAKPVPVKKTVATKPAQNSSAAAKREAARIQANKEAAARRARLKKKREAEARAKKSNSSSSSSVSSSKPQAKPTPPPTPKKPVVKPKSKFRTATSIPGKPGFVFNPWTNKAVDVRGIPGGSVVRDPNDGNPDHKFRVP